MKRYREYALNLIVRTFGVAMVLWTGALQAQPVATRDAAQLLLAMRKLNVLGSVLYIAAHPDDENTALLAYMANQRHMRSAYLSLTRGDGGQNLIGPEQSEFLGLIRTQELLAARRIDGAEQYFTRAKDFGYSKSPEEALSIWNREDILSDMVAIIRAYQPDVVITRFSPTMGGHGHHTASAVLAREAFDAAGDPGRYPDQIARGLKPWKPKRMLFNVARFLGTQVDTVNALKLDLGEYNPVLGRSITELSGMARTMHKSQGFGVPQNRGSSINYFQNTAGEPATGDLFDGINTSWSRIPGGESVGGILARADSMFDVEHPAASIPLLLEAMEAMKNLGNDPWVVQKQSELREVLRLCAGIWIEAISSRFSITPGETLGVAFSAINRSGVNVVLEATHVSPIGRIDTVNQPLSPNIPVKMSLPVFLPEKSRVPITQPYWLQKPSLAGEYVLPSPDLVLKAEDPPPLTATFRLRFGTHSVDLETAVRYRWVDPVDGELYRPLEITPPLMANLLEEVVIFPDPRSRPVSVRVLAGKDGAAAKVSLALPRGWESMPSEIPLMLSKKGDEQTVTFRLLPHADAEDGILKVVFDSDDGRTARGTHTIQYSHIPHITLFPLAEAKVIRTDITRSASKIGYITGAGDNVPAALQQLGYDVELLSNERLATGDLSDCRAIVAGVRAYNTRDRLAGVKSRLMEYVKNGGTYIVQYSTAPVDSMIGPYRINISRDRVTDENAVVTFPDPRHPLLTTPNKINQRDFIGWIQERGLYFADRWDPAVEPVLSCHDPGEPPREGGLLYAKYGKGVFIYAAYAFFRQLPAGVPGAYRLFVNLIESNRSFYRKEKK